MSLNIERPEAEAVFLLKGANPGAWAVVLGLFKRKYKQEQDKCVDTQRENVEIHQGKARAFRDLVNIEEEAQRLQEAGKKINRSGEGHNRG